MKGLRQQAQTWSCDTGQADTGMLWQVQPAAPDRESLTWTGPLRPMMSTRLTALCRRASWACRAMSVLPRTASSLSSTRAQSRATLPRPKMATRSHCAPARILCPSHAMAQWRQRLLGIGRSGTVQEVATDPRQRTCERLTGSSA